MIGESEPRNQYPRQKLRKIACKYKARPQTSEPRQEAGSQYGKETQPREKGVLEGRNRGLHPFKTCIQIIEYGSGVKNPLIPLRGVRVSCYKPGVVGEHGFLIAYNYVQKALRKELAAHVEARGCAVGYV